MRRSEMLKMLRQGHVRDEHHRRIKQDTRLTPESVVRLPERIKRFQKTSERRMHRLSTLEIVYEDGDLYVINKPAGVHSQPGINVDLALSNMIGRHDRMVHRLDKPVSGLMIIAKSRDIASTLSEQWSQIHKTYHAICHRRTSDISLGQSGIFTSDIDDKKAMSKYLVLAMDDDFVKLQLHPVTGRKRQLRIHCERAGLSIVRQSASMIYLSCVELSLNHPATGRPLRINFDDPESFSAIFNKQ